MDWIPANYNANSERKALCVSPIPDNREANRCPWKNKASPEGIAAKALFNIRLCAFMLMMLPVVLSVDESQASGMGIHIYMADMSIQSVENDEVREILKSNWTAYRNGAIFPDSGYAVGHPYGEYAHWDGFVIDYFDEVKAQCFQAVRPDCQSIIAHFFGSLSHSIADVLFDSYFVTETARHDFKGSASVAQNYTDPGIDFISTIEHLRGPIVLLNYNPMDVLVTVLNKRYTFLDRVDSGLLNKGFNIQRLALLGEPAGTPFVYLYFKYKMPWGGSNYMHARGGVYDTARVIATVIDRVYPLFKSRKTGREIFGSKGWGWPYVDFYILNRSVHNM